MILNPETLPPKRKHFSANKAAMTVTKFGVRFTKKAARIMGWQHGSKIQILLENNVIGLEICNNGYEIKSYETDSTYQILNRVLGRFILTHFQCEKISFELIKAVGTDTIFELKQLTKL